MKPMSQTTTSPEIEVGRSHVKPATGAMLVGYASEEFFGDDAFNLFLERSVVEQAVGENAGYTLFSRRCRRS